MRLLNEFETNLLVSFDKFYFYHTRGINIIELPKELFQLIYSILFQEIAESNSNHKDSSILSKIKFDNHASGLRSYETVSK